MKRKLYYKLLKLLKNKKAAEWMAGFVFAVVSTLCRIGVSLGACRKRSALSAEQARQKLQAYSPKPTAREMTDTKSRQVQCQLSIIVPAYNAEATIRRCMESVLRQKCDVDYEVIAINDGSTDKTGALLEKYQKNARVKVITQGNRGFSGARNAGIALARGQYLSFLDSDDELAENAIAGLMGKALETDAAIVAGSYETVYKDHAVASRIPDAVLQTEKIDSIVGVAGGFPWGKVFKRALFEQVRFPEGYLFEDTIMAFLICRMAKGQTVASVGDIVYRYYKNDKGITATYHSSPRCLEGYWIVEKMLEETKRIGLPLDEEAFNLVLGHLNLAYWRTFGLKREMKEAIFILSAELLEAFDESCGCEQGDYWRRQALRAYKNRQFGLWLLAEAMM